MSVIADSCSLKVATQNPLALSHSLTSPSLVPVAMSLPIEAMASVLWVNPFWFMM